MNLFYISCTVQGGGLGQPHDDRWPSRHTEQLILIYW